MKKSQYIIARITIIGIICTCIISYLFSHYDGDKYTIENAEDYVRRVCEIGNVPGMSIIILDNEQEYYINVGYADKDEKLDITSGTGFELGSTTKAFTGLGVLLLEKDNKLNRNDLVRDYLTWFQPTYKGEKADVTIEHLLCHTSGIPAWTIGNIPIGTVNDVGLLERTIKEIQAVELDDKPGTAHEYATINYDVLALIIEEVSGMAYEEYIEKNILEPLGMTKSYFRTDDTKYEQLAQGYKYAFMGTRKYDAPTFYGNTAAGYLVSNIADLAIWMKTQMGILETDVTKENDKLRSVIMESHLYPIDQGQNYFAGWNLYDTYLCHSGNNPNYSSQVYIGRTNGKAVFALANIGGSSPTKVADGIYSMLQGETVKIGFWTDFNSFVDLLCAIWCLVELCLMVLLFEHKEKIKYAWIRVFIFIIFAIILALIPYILHYNYLTLAVWFSPCLLIAMGGMEIYFVEYIILSMSHLRSMDSI